MKSGVQLLAIVKQFKAVYDVKRWRYDNGLLELELEQGGKLVFRIAE